MSNLKLISAFAAMLGTTISIALTPEIALSQTSPQIALHQDIGSMYVMLGRQKFEAGEYQKAVEILNSAIKADSKNVEAMFWRGVSYDSLKQGDLAIADFDRTITLDKDHGLAYYMRGLNYSTKKDYGKAIADLEIASKLLKAAGNNRYAQSADETLGVLRVLNK